MKYSAYYIQQGCGNRMRMIFNVSLDFMKHIGFEYERSSFLFASFLDDGFRCQYFVKENKNEPSFKWNPYIEMESWHNSMAVDQ